MTLDSLYLDGTQEWQDAGKWSVRIMPKSVELTRVIPAPFGIPGCLERKVMRVTRENWESGLRVFAPGQAGVPLVIVDPATLRSTTGGA
jgi:hypothetical protein